MDEKSIQNWIISNCIIVILSTKPADVVCLRMRKKNQNGHPLYDIQLWVRLYCIESLKRLTITWSNTATETSFILEFVWMIDLKILFDVNAKSWSVVPTLQKSHILSAIQIGFSSVFLSLNIDIVVPKDLEIIGVHGMV